MAECGACRAVIPIDSTACTACGVSFSGVAEDEMGECGACGTLVPLDSKSCSQCGVHFVLDDLTTALSDWMKDETLTISELFGVVDVDNDGSLTAAEVKGALLDRQLAFLGENELDRFLSQIDLNDDGLISFPELAAALSMPWSPPEELTVLVPEVEEKEDSDNEEDESGDDEDDSDEDSDNDEEDESGDDEDDSDEDSDDDEEDESDDDEDDSDEDSDDDEEDESDDDEDDSDDDEEDESDDDDSEEDESGDDEEDSDEDPDDDKEDESGEDASDDDEDDSEGEDSTADDGTQSEKPESEGPAEWQRFLMRNYENAFPILYTIGVLFVGLWIINAMGFLVDGSGGPIAYNGDVAYTESMMNTDGFFETTVIQPGDIYECRDDVQVGGCNNSLTPFAGENGASSMPAGFHWDGILFMALGLVGLGGIAYLQMQIKEMRSEHRRKKDGDSNDDSEAPAADNEDDSGDESGTDTGEDEDSDADDSNEDMEDGSDDDDSEEEDDSDDDDSDDDDSEEEDDSDDDSEEEDGIEIGSRVGVEDEDGDWYGEVVEFDDEEDAVVVKREDDGEQYTVDWDSLFQDD
mgnify:CR=1 FL=1